MLLLFLIQIRWSSRRVRSAVSRSQITTKFSPYVVVSIRPAKIVRDYSTT